MARGFNDAGALILFADGIEIAMGDDLAVLVGDDHVGDIGVFQRVANQQAERQLIPGD